MLKNILVKAKSQRLLLLVGATTVVSGVIVVYGVSRLPTASQHMSSAEALSQPATAKVAALGRIEPETKVIRLSAPLELDGDRLEEIIVKEGDKVKSGQVIAILDSRRQLQTAVLQAETQVKVAQGKLAQIQAGAKVGEIEAQQATVERLQAQLEADTVTQQQEIARINAQWLGERQAHTATIKKLQGELNNAEAEYQRYQQLSSQGAISNSLLDSKSLTLETAKQQLKEAQAILERINATASRELAAAEIALQRINSTGKKQIREAQALLNSIKEVRPVDIEAAKTEVENARANLKQAQTKLESAYIKAPISGRIMQINALVGEKIRDGGIVDLAATEQMMVIAEVYQTDISKVKPGQSAVITSQAFANQLKGEVVEIGLQVNRQNVFSNQPGENLDSRVVEVKIRLNPESSQEVAGLTNLQVQAVIDL